MAKGKTTAPLRIGVYPAWLEHPAVRELAAAGHVVGSYHVVGEPDWIMHPAAGWNELFFAEHVREDGTKHRPFVEARVKAERARKKGKTA